jgi:hypothetical protein
MTKLVNKLGTFSGKETGNKRENQIIGCLLKHIKLERQVLT